LDTQTGYVRDFLRFIGVSDVEFVYAEGLSISPQIKEAGLARRWRDRASCRLRASGQRSCDMAQSTRFQPESRMITRSLVDVIESIATSDGAGVQLRRSVGSRRGLYVIPSDARRVLFG